MDFTNLKQSLFKKEFYLLTLVIVIAIFIDIVYFKIFANKYFVNYPISDAINYLFMSYHPFDPTVAAVPYIYRILTPYIVYLLPFNHFIGFPIVNYLSIFINSVLFYFYLKKLQFSKLICIIGVLFLILSPVTIYNIYSIFSVDPLSFFFFLLALYAILIKDDKLYVLALVIGVLNKETILITIPLFFICKYESLNIKEAIKATILTSIPPIIIFLLVRSYFSIKNFTSYNSGKIQATLSYFISEGLPILYQIYMPFGILEIIFLINLLKGEIPNNFLRKSFILLPFIALQILIGTDIYRVIFIAFPIIIPVALYFFQYKYSLITYLGLIALSILQILVTVYFWQRYKLAVVGNIVLDIFALLMILIALKKFYGKSILHS